MSKPPRLSIVIPTRNRRESLERVLTALDEQRNDVPDPEIVVVDDGSVDGTLQSLRARLPTGTLILEQRQGGPARARNRGAAAASGDVLLFLGDDTVPEPGFLRTHAEAHAGSVEPIAVLGYTTWDRDRMRVTPLLTHLNERGLQFGFSLIRDPENVPFNFFYTSNVSLSKALFLSQGGFDESFPFAAWEDIEFAYRATRAVPPLRIVYRPGARVLHHHPTSLSDFRLRQFRAGRAGALFASKHPELRKWLGTDAALLLNRRRPIHLVAAEHFIGPIDRAGIPLPGRCYDSLFRWDYLSGLRYELDALSRPEQGTPGAN